MNVLDELNNFYCNFQLEKGYIGQTSNKKLIPYFCVEKTKSPVLLATYAIHGREYITTYLALKQIDCFIKWGRVGKVFFIPAVNIDGIEISLYKDKLNKANANGVDLNVNFDAHFGEGEQNVFYPGNQNYVGRYPFSESESRALRDFTLKVMPDITLSYHSKGEEIYWSFFQNEIDKARDKILADELAKVTGYKPKEIFGSVGGYKDWCIEKLKIPSFTIEVGKDNLTHPIKKRYLGDIYRKNKKVIPALIDKYLESKWKRNFF